MKRKALAIVLTLVMLVGVLPMGAFAASYTDTEGHWAEKSIDRWTEAKVLEGRGDNLYAPDDHLTRAEAMTIFSRLLNLTEKGDISKLEDVAADAWYAPYIETGYAYEIIKGTSDTTFDPSGTITREQFFSIFARATGIPGTDKLDEGKTFTDLDQISSWFVEEGTVYSMINRGYLNGYPDGSLQPKGNITRAEVAKVLDNAISDYITADGTYAISGDGIVVVLAKNVKLTGTNFNGHIVSSCNDSTLDLSGLTGTPYIYVLGDNTKIINAKPGTTVAVNPAADNVTVNNVKVAYNPYAPVSPYVVPAAQTIGGGGGGGGSYYPDTFNVALSLKPPFGKNSLMLTANGVFGVNDALQGLVKDSASVSENAIQHAMDRMKAEKTTIKFETGKDDADNPIYDIYTVYVEVNDGVYTIKVENAGHAINLQESMDLVTNQFLSNMNDARDRLDNANEKAAWDQISAAFNPSSMFTNYKAGQQDGVYYTSMDFKGAGEYATKLDNVLKALDAMATADVERNFVDELNLIVTKGHETAGLDWDNYGVDYEVVAKAIQNKTLVSGDISITAVDIQNPDDVNEAAQGILGVNIRDDMLLQALVYAGLKENVKGPYTLIAAVQ